jgi:hypothetical protein
MPECLYHGTSAVRLESIKKKGIVPRIKSRVEGNWTHTVKSNRNSVYLTDAYAWHFAACASSTEENGLILEIDKDQLFTWLLCPDEDALEQGTRTLIGPNFAPTNWGMLKRTKFYRKIAPLNPHLADESLKVMGTCGYYGIIPWSAVTRYVTIDWKKLDPSLRMQAIDSQVSIANYKFLQDRHKAFTRWFFGDEVNAGEVTGYDLEKLLTKRNETEDAVEITAVLEQQNKRMAEAMANRIGLQVVEVKND